MNEKLLLEHVDRVGLVTLRKLAGRAGTVESLQKPVLALVAGKKVLLCRLDHGAETLLSTHLFFCLMSVCTEPELPPAEQDIFDWLCDNEPATRQAIRASGACDGSAFESAFAELQRKLCVLPAGGMAAAPVPPGGGEAELVMSGHLHWVTAETWAREMHRPGRYRKLEYCVSEIRRLMRGHFATRELNKLLYRGTL